MATIPAFITVGAVVAYDYWCKQCVVSRVIHVAQGGRGEAHFTLLNASGYRHIVRVVAHKPERMDPYRLATPEEVADFEAQEALIIW